MRKEDQSIVIRVPADITKDRRDTIKVHQHDRDINGGKVDASPPERRQSFYPRQSIAQLRKQSLVVVISLWSSFRGVFYAAAASLCFSTSGCLAKQLSGVSPTLLSFIRFVIAAIMSTPVVATIKVDNIFLGPKGLRTYVIARALLGAIAIYLRFETIQLLPIANAMVLVLSAPVFVAIFARIFLKEPCGIFHLVALVVTMAGIACTAKLDRLFEPSEGSESSAELSLKIAGMFCGIATALTTSIAIVVLRKLKNVHFMVTTFNTAWIASIEAGIQAYFTGGFKLPEGNTAPWLIMALGVSSFYGQLFMTRALQIEEAAIVSVVQCSLDLVMAFLFQIFIFQEIPDLETIIGSALVFTAVVLTSWRKYIATLPPNYRLRKWFNFILK